MIQDSKALIRQCTDINHTNQRNNEWLSTFSTLSIIFLSISVFLQGDRLDLPSAKASTIMPF